MRTVEKPIFFSLRNKYNHVTDVGGPWGLWDSRWTLSCKITRLLGT
jgi:hypothetical protein